MLIPDTLSHFLKPLVLSSPADEKQLPSNLPRQLSSIINHFQNKKGNIVMFTAASPSANTAAANLLGKQTSTDICCIDLSMVVSKYLGETEKNLLQIFEFAQQHRFTLLFDEVDSVFGKRTDVRDSHDDYANLEVGYLLHRIEAYSGLAIMTTNMQNNLDDALLRAVPWQIDPGKVDLPRPVPWWQKFFNWFRKRK